ncbi:unnamed protein product, partial [Rotaria magnacalcarata]
MTEAMLASRLRDIEEEMRSERDIRFQEAINARDREFEANKRLKQEVHDLRQKLELQSSENDENLNGIRRRFQDT